MVIVVGKASTTITIPNTLKISAIIKITLKMNVQTKNIMGTITMTMMGTRGENLATMAKILINIKIAKGVNLITLIST